MFNDLLNPLLGSKPITTITAPEILTVLLRKLAARGKHETATGCGSATLRTLGPFLDGK